MSDFYDIRQCLSYCSGEIVSTKPDSFRGISNEAIQANIELDLLIQLENFAIRLKEQEMMRLINEYGVHWEENTGSQIGSGYRVCEEMIREISRYKPPRTIYC